jgi:hypothetical protein
LDRERRPFYVGTVSEIRSWLMLRGALCNRQVCNRLRRRSPDIAVQELFAWLDEEKPVPVSTEFVAGWERKFPLQQTIAVCTGLVFGWAWIRTTLKRF